MHSNSSFDALFQHAVAAVDSGDENVLKKLPDQHLELATHRLNVPGKWLTEVIPDALNSFFKDPYLLWFVAEDPVRNNTLPPNVDSIAAIIIDKVKIEKTNFQEQINYALKLVAWSGVAHKCGVQVALLDVLIDAGASTDGVSNDALVNGHFDAAKHLVHRGAKITLATALCLEKWQDADILAVSATTDQKQFSLVLAALNGKAEAVKRVIAFGVDINKPSDHLYSHGTPLHHAVWSGSIETVKILVEAGAHLNTRDTEFDGTPLGWALYGRRKEVSDFLVSIGARE